MFIGVVSDTHNNLLNIDKIIEIFNEKKVESVIHTGDITKARSLEKFSSLNCDFFAVYGNNDSNERLGGTISSSLHAITQGVPILKNYLKGARGRKKYLQDYNTNIIN